MSSSNDIASKIREANRRRAEEGSRIRQLQQERREEMLEREAEKAASKPSGFIPYIIISLIFLSFPLSEPIVDWVLVACFALLNGAWVLFFRSASWVNWGTLALCDFSLIRISHVIPHIPRLIKETPPHVLAAFIGGNLVAMVILYYAYVVRRLPWKTEVGSKKPKRVKRSDGEEVETLEEFARRRERANRIDNMFSGLIVANVVVLVLVGAIPFRTVFDAVRQIIGFFH
ncbi:uncharacterized protein TEOVI_000040400 [Trypanosoma equiperdum]|uniref:Uncharacterized protein n=4 Tax=Trypanozoon TaxID=39700 RepID=Q582J9_TRYB2|nr:hypothetical protein, conserved [Trypanosoma brucei gambiense DAL972]XP_846207.1 hypothetical protein, conserved [Trypanosoma brucei brucei TREU927]AAX78833.1 hypothetical protein, conserved [Trypanosoma brucei]RHW71621.1 hypothetical protein DPX39_070069400 [Trypanosoma brucei equiperdum]SCU67176.1 hypothetical protein, conserved [Trypanosoma equiperdum]AAZ12648.1 hypothetical protein, conserved [Trypanosoma brucei brucei TREU927]CBH12789.1 hypothetical protein, conserved [Trypanosoma bru|eukprot:XP_011775069.1 hypothetical protein, conserved [Trypanosoma brucei gambiense DAL972]